MENRSVHVASLNNISRPVIVIFQVSPLLFLGSEILRFKHFSSRRFDSRPVLATPSALPGAVLQSRHEALLNAGQFITKE